MENMDEVREWVKSRTAVSAASIQRKFRVGYPAAARAIDVLQEEARITEDWDASEGGYVVLGRQSNTGLQRTGGTVPQPNKEPDIQEQIDDDIQDYLASR